MRAVKFGTLLLLVALSAAAATHAQVGVGVSLAKIVLDEPVVGGGSYDLPTVGVVNTGKEAGDYEVGVSYRSGQKQMKVPAEWISFTPKTFYLNAGEVRQVAVRLQVPMKAKPGDYFGFIETLLQCEAFKYLCRHRCEGFDVFQCHGPGLLCFAGSRGSDCRGIHFQEILPHSIRS